jgi:hypothetical protein
VFVRLVFEMGSVRGSKFSWDSVYCSCGCRSLRPQILVGMIV